MILPNTWQIIRRHPYLLPFLVLILLCVAMGYAWQAVVKAANCPECTEGKGLCLVACEKVSRRLDEIDRSARVVRHPCTGCDDYKYGCDDSCTRLLRWEVSNV